MTHSTRMKSILELVCGLSLAIASQAVAQGPTPLTIPQRTAVREALRKLFNFAFAHWPGDDKRWGALEAAEATHQESDGSSHQNEPQVDDVDMYTEPRAGALSSKVANDVILNSNNWGGLPQFRNKWRGLEDPLGCWVLAAALLHEGDHQDDDYPWPPALPGDRKKHYCEEEAATVKELETLSDAQDDLPAGEAEKLEPRIKELRGALGRWRRLKAD